MKENKTPTTFADLVSKYNADPTSEKALTDLGQAVACSVLKKVINTTANPTLQIIRADLFRANADLASLQYANDNATRLTFNQDGDPVVEVLDPVLVQAAAKAADQTLGDGLDLVHDAIIAILEQTAAQRERDPDQPIDLERPFTVRRLKRKVWIKLEESVSGWEETETTPIQEAYKAVRRSIDASRAAQTDPRNGYSYLEDLAIDSESGEQATIYRRLPKYADLGGHVCDFNGKETVATSADRATVEDTDRIIAALNLTTRQATILAYRQKGYGYKAIATAMGATDSAVKGQVAEIRRKWKTAGLPTP